MLYLFIIILIQSTQTVQHTKRMIPVHSLDIAEQMGRDKGVVTPSMRRRKWPNYAKVFRIAQIFKFPAS